MVAIQAQIQALIAGEAVAGRGVEGLNTELNMEVAKLPVFNREAERVGEFITSYRLYLRMKMKEATVEEQIQWILSYIQEGSADMWKENVLEDLEAGEFLAGLKREFEEGNEEAVKIAELKRIE